MKKFTVMPTVEDNITVTLIASFLFIIGIFAIIIGVVYLFASLQIMGGLTWILFYGSMILLTALWRFLLGLLIKPFQHRR
ncbi:MAG: hypothetical protein LBM60_01345 [Clostridium sp.]|jgi:hypothetical protein|nr:hypothetical protein [Clostridium sp.]